MTDNQITFRLASPDDAAAVDALLARSYAQLLVGGLPPGVLEAALALIGRARPDLLASGTYWLALRSGQVVGAGGWTRADPRQARHRLWASGMCVMSPPTRRLCVRGLVGS